MLVFNFLCTEEEVFEKSILNIEDIYIQNILDSEYVARCADVNKALKILVKKHNVDVLDFDELYNFVCKIFKAENVETESKDGFLTKYGDDVSDMQLHEFICTMPDGKQEWSIYSKKNGKLSTAPHSMNFCVNALFSNNKEIFTDEKAAKITRISLQEYADVFDYFKKNNCEILERNELKSGGVLYEFSDDANKKRYALAYLDVTGFICDKNPVFVTMIVSDNELIDKKEISDGYCDSSYTRRLQCLGYDVPRYFED